MGIQGESEVWIHPVKVDMDKDRKWNPGHLSIKKGNNSKLFSHNTSFAQSPRNEVLEGSSTCLRVETH